LRDSYKKINKLRLRLKLKLRLDKHKHKHKHKYNNRPDRQLHCQRFRRRSCKLIWPRPGRETITFKDPVPTILPMLAHFRCIKAQAQDSRLVLVAVLPLPLRVFPVRLKQTQMLKRERLPSRL